MRKTPTPQEIYRHFKGNLYQILCIAKHSENGEELVIYQALYGTYGVYARPLTMFMEEVDTEKYPDVVQKYRFEKIEKDTLNITENVIDKKDKESIDETVQSSQGTLETQSDSNMEEEYIDPKVVEFLDARTYEEKLGILYSMRENLTDDMINIMAVAEDMEVKSGSIEERYEEFKSCLLTLNHFECSRLH